MKVLAVLVLILGLSIYVNAQKAVLKGTVYDTYKAVVVGTKILIKDKKNKVYTIETNDSGEYEIKLPFGNYTIEFSQAGFKVFRVINLQIKSESKKTFDVTLEVGRCEDCNGAIYGERSDDHAVLSGIVYDQTGEVIQNAKVTAIGLEKEKIEVFTDTSGNYKLKLPFKNIGNYNVNAPSITKYTFKFESRGFRVFEIKDFNFTGTKSGEMQLDVLLEVGINND